jgi:hypothetical protein
MTRDDVRREILPFSPVERSVHALVGIDCTYRRIEGVEIAA